MLNDLNPTLLFNVHNSHTYTTNTQITLQLLHVVQCDTIINQLYVN